MGRLRIEATNCKLQERTPQVSNRLDVVKPLSMHKKGWKDIGLGVLGSHNVYIPITAMNTSWFNMVSRKGIISSEGIELNGLFMTIIQILSATCRRPLFHSQRQ
jgi:hypothetical protein